MTTIEEGVRRYSDSPLDNDTYISRGIDRRVDRSKITRIRERARRNVVLYGVMGLVGLAAAGLLTVQSRYKTTAERMQNSSLSQSEAERAAQQRHIRHWLANAESHPFRTYELKTTDTLWGVLTKTYGPNANIDDKLGQLEENQGINSVNAYKRTLVLPASAPIGVLHQPRVGSGE